MTEDIDEMGPIDFVLIEYSGKLTGEAAPPLLDLVDRGLIRIFDILFVHKGGDGTARGLRWPDLEPDEREALAEFEGADSGLLGDEDVQSAADVMEPGTTAVLLVFENAWAAPFATAVRNSGGRLIADGRIPTQAILAALEETAS